MLAALSTLMCGSITGRLVILIPLQSGSAGNCLFVQSGEVRLLFDAGISGSQVRDRLAAYQVDPLSIHGLFITHEHADHIKCAGVLGRKFKIPVHMTRPTYNRSWRRMGLENLPDLRHFRSGDRVRIGHVTIESVPTPHDAVDGVVYVVDDGMSRLGICTDVGHVFAELHDLVSSVDALFLETNYDTEMLENGKYPYVLKKRISGPGGHISNLEAAELVAASASSRLQWLYAGHLSQENNHPEKVLATLRAALGSELEIHLAQRYVASQKAEVRISNHMLQKNAVTVLAGLNPTKKVVDKGFQPELFPGF